MLTNTKTKLGSNKYLVGLGNDSVGNPMISANGAGKYSLEYTAVINVLKNEDIAVNVRNNVMIRILTGAGGYTEFVEPMRDGRQFYIDTIIKKHYVGAF